MSPLFPSLCTGQSSLALLLWIVPIARRIHQGLSAQLLMGINLMAGPLWAFFGTNLFRGDALRCLKTGWPRVCVRISETSSPLLGVPRSASLFDPLISSSDVTEIPARGRLLG